MKQKRFVALVLSILLVTPVIQPQALPVHATSQIEYIPLTVPNGSFETEMTEGEMPNWTVSPARQDFADTLEATASTTRFSDGSKSLYMSDDGPKSLEVKSDLIPITELETYRASAKVFIEAKSVRMYLRYFGESGTTDLNGGQVSILANTVGSWVNVDIEGYAPAGAKYAQITFYYGASGVGTYAYIDDVQLAKKYVPESTVNPPYTSNPINLGNTVKIGLSHKAVMSTVTDSVYEMYVTTTGSPVSFSVFDPLTGERKSDQLVNGMTDPVWGMAKGSDDNIYFASTGKLARYDVTAKTVSVLGTDPTGYKTSWDVAASDDGKIYGSTAHTSTGGKIYEYDIASETFTDLGVILAGNISVRGIGVSGNYLYAALGSKNGFVKINRTTYEKTSITIPGVTGLSGTLNDVEIFSGHIFVYGSNKVHVLNEETEQYINSFDYAASTRISPPSPENPNLVYYKLGDKLYSYSMETYTASVIPNINQPLPDTAFKMQEWINAETGPFPGQTVLYSMAAWGDTFVFEPISGQYAMIYNSLPTIATQINVLEHNNGKLFMSGFQRGMSILDTETDRLVLEEPSFHQAEGIGFYGDITYFGTYTGAKMYRLDMSNPIDYKEFGAGNPGLALDIGDAQNRPFIIESGEGKIFTGTFPESGFQGALTVLEEQYDASGNFTHIDSITYPSLIHNQTIIGLAYANNKLYGSTTVYGSSGSLSPTPPTYEAKVFIFNPETGQVEKSVTPVVDGVTNSVKIIGDISVGPDGLIWGIQDAFIGNPGGYDASIFALDPVTLEVVKSKRIDTTVVSTSKYRPYFIRWGEDGLMYTTIARKLYVINPDTLEAVNLLPSVTGVNLMTIADNGDIYYVNGTTLFKLPMIVEANAPQLDTTLTVGQSEAISISLTTPTNQTRDINKATSITYTSSDETVVSIVGSNATAVAEGTSKIKAMIVYENQTVESTEVEVTVTAGSSTTPEPTPLPTPVVDGNHVTYHGEPIMTLPLSEINIDAIITISTETSSFTLEPSKLPLQEWADEFGVSVDELNLIVTQVQASQETQNSVLNATNIDGSELLSPVYQFNVEVGTTTGQLTSIKDFGTPFVARSIMLDTAIPEGAFVAYFDSTSNRLKYVPSIAKGNTINFYTPVNGDFVIVSDVNQYFKENLSHWARLAIKTLLNLFNDINYEHYEPGREKSREQFTFVINRALELLGSR